MRKLVLIVLSVWCVSAMGQNTADEYASGRPGSDSRDVRTERRDVRPERRDVRPERRDARPERRDVRPERRELRIDRRFYVAQVATEEQVNMIIDCLKQESFDDAKLRVAELSVTLCPVLAADLKKIAELFSFDDRRLQFLQYAYAFCPDREHYIGMKNTFSFSSNFDKLVDYIQEYEERLLSE